MDLRRHERGAALGIVLILAIIFSVSAFAALTMALSGRQRTNLYEERLRAHYAAEAGLVWAMQKLWVNPTFCFPGSPDLFLDTNGDGTNDTKVDITASPCAPATANRTLTAKVVY